MNRLNLPHQITVWDWYEEYVLGAPLCFLPHADYLTPTCPVDGGPMIAVYVPVSTGTRNSPAANLDVYGGQALPAFSGRVVGVSAVLAGYGECICCSRPVMGKPAEIQDYPEYDRHQYQKRKNWFSSELYEALQPRACDDPICATVLGIYTGRLIGAIRRCWGRDIRRSIEFGTFRECDRVDYTVNQILTEMIVNGRKIRPHKGGPREIEGTAFRWPEGCDSFLQLTEQGDRVQPADDPRPPQGAS